MRRHHLVPGQKKAYDSGALPIGAVQGHLLFKHNVELGFSVTHNSRLRRRKWINGFDLGFDCTKKDFWRFTYPWYGQLVLI